MTFAFWWQVLFRLALFLPWPFAWPSLLRFNYREKERQLVWVKVKSRLKFEVHAFRRSL